MIRSLSFALAMLFAGPATAVAQESTTLAELRAGIAKIEEDISAQEKVILASDATDLSLAASKAALETLSQRTLEVAIKASTYLRKLDEQLTALGAAPDPNTTPEPEAIASERHRLSVAKAETALSVRAAEKLTINISGLIENIVRLRSDKFVRAVFARHPISFSVLLDAWGSLAFEAGRLKFAFQNWLRILSQRSASEAITATVLSFGFGALILILTRLFVRPLIARPISYEEQPYLRRVFAALWTTLVPSAAWALLLTIVYFSFKNLDLLPNRIDAMFKAFLTATGVLMFVIFVMRGALAPGKPNWRVFAVSDRAAVRLNLFVCLMAILYVSDFLFGEIRKSMASPVSLTVVASFVWTVLFSAVLALILQTSLNDEETDGERIRLHGWAPWFYWPMWAAIILIIGAVAAGYLSLARFLAGQIVVTGAILIAMYIGILSARAISLQGALAQSRLGVHLLRRLQFSELSVDQLGLVFGGLLLVGTLIVGTPFLLLQWGFQRDDVLSWISRGLSGFNVGDVRISFANIVLAIIAFIIGLIVTRIFQRWLTSNVLTRTRLDSGVQHSVGAGVGYIGFIIAAIIALEYTGLDLSNLALIAGALSVGIGFGLQNVVNNFVSGIILLIERPIRIGDWIVVGNTEGYVKNISVRATELETFDRQSIVIPNAELINTSVGNWMLKDKTGRLIVQVGVSYDADEEQVRDILYQITADDNRIATYPEPYVYFKDFGDNALVFQVRVFLKDVADIIKVGGDMRFSIRKAFKQAGIVIPYPQRDVYVHETQAAPDMETITRKGKQDA